MYLLDADTLSNLLKPVPSTNLVAKLARVPLPQQYTSAITVGELVYGAHKRRNGMAALLQRIDELMSSDRPILPFDTDAARRYGEIRVYLERQGTPIGGSDMRIAAIALVHNLIVVTDNVRHFQRVPNLVVENWLQEPDA